MNKSNDFEFKTISSKCTDFKITGSAAYNKEKTSIYISNILYTTQTLCDILTIYSSITVFFWRYYAK